MVRGFALSRQNPARLEIMTSHRKGACLTRRKRLGQSLMLMRCGHTTVARAVARIPGRRLGTLCQHAKDGQGRRPQRPVATGEIVDESNHRVNHSTCSCRLRSCHLLQNIAPEPLRPAWIGPLGLANAGDPSATRSRCEAPSGSAAYPASDRLRNPVRTTSWCIQATTHGPNAPHPDLSPIKTSGAHA